MIPFQEVPPEKGRAVLKIIHSYKHATSIFDDFIHYEKRQEEDEGRKPPPGNKVGSGRSSSVVGLFIYLDIFRILPRVVIDPGLTRVTTNLGKKDRERGETGEGETESRARPENNRTESRASRATVEKTAGTTGGRKTRGARLRAGVGGILARNKFFFLLTLLSLQFIEYPTNHILIYVITKT